MSKNTFSMEKCPDGSPYKIGIVLAKWNNEVTKKLYKSAFDTLIKKGVKEKNITTIAVPGSFELIYGSALLQSKNINAIIAIGCVIQGDTKHFDYICEGVTQGIKDLNLFSDKPPVIFCVLTTEDKQQALERCSETDENKGAEAAITAIEMAYLKNNT